MKDWKVSLVRRSVRKRVGDEIHRVRNALRRHRANRKTVGAGIILPFATEENLEVGDHVVALLAAHSVEAEIGNVVLAAGIEAAADFDAQAANDFIHLGVLRSKTFAQFAREATGSGDSQFAGVCARARSNINDRFGDGRCEFRLFQFRIHGGEVGVADPAKHEILLDGAANRLLHILAGNVGNFAELGCGDISQRKREGDC